VNAIFSNNKFSARNDSVAIESVLKDAAKKLYCMTKRPRLEAEILMAHALGRERIWLHAHSGESISPEGLTRFLHFVQRRLESEPIEYITGSVSFYDLELHVGPGVLIARPETEILVDMAAEIVEKNGIERICEIGVGSAAVSIMLALKFPHLQITATDISSDALFYAKKNIEKYGVQKNIRLEKADLMEGVEGDFEMIVSNPPYIKSSFLLPDSLKHEPSGALFGGEAGDELLKRIIMTAKEREIGYLLCEMGYDQREAILKFCKQNTLPIPTFYKDLAGLDRGFYIKF